MIFRCERDVGYERHDFGKRMKTPEEGTFSILNYELAYGGRVATITKHNMTVVTPVFGKTDYTYVSFETEEEFQMMVTALYYWYKASEEVKEDPNLIDAIMEITEGNAFLVTHGTPLIFGERTLRLALLMAFGIHNRPDIIEKLANVAEEDLATLAELVREGSSWEEALGLL